MQHYWVIKGRLPEGRAWLDRAVALCDAAPLQLRAAVLREASWFSRHAIDHNRAEELGEQALALSREQGDPTGIAHALTSLGWIAEGQGRFVQARTYHEEALELSRGLADPSWTAWSTRNVGMQAFMLGELDVAEGWLAEALALFRQGGYHFGTAFVLSNLAEIALVRGDFARAAALWREWLDLSWHTTGLIHCLRGMAKIAAAYGQARWAARLQGAAEAHRERLGYTLMPKQAAMNEKILGGVRAALGDTVFAAAWAEGRRLSADEARAEATWVIDAIQEAVETRSFNRSAAHVLTPRELEILKLVADGRSDREIAAVLFIGPATVHTHLANAFGKLDVGSRTAAVAAARRLGIL